MKCEGNNLKKRKLSPNKTQKLPFSKRTLAKDFQAFEDTVNVERFKERLLKRNHNVECLTSFEKFSKLRNTPDQNVCFTCRKYY